MTDTSTPPQWIELFHSDDPRDVVHRAVACLAQGGVIGLATESVYCLTASALNEPGVARLRGLPGYDCSSPLTMLLKGPEEATDWVTSISHVGRRLARRLWPGPLTMIFPPGKTDGLFGRLPQRVQRLVSPQGSLALRNAADPFIRDVLELSPAPLVLRGLTLSGDAPAVNADSLRGITPLDMVVDSGPTQYGQWATRVRIDDQSWTIEREGVIDAGTLRRMSSLI